MAFKVDVEFINPFVSGAIETLKTQAQTDCKIGKIFEKSSQSEPLKIEIAALIGLTSKYFNGSIALCFTKRAFLGVMNRMLGENYVEINKDLEDGAGELLNIMFGVAKRGLNDKGYSIEKAIPSIIRGQNLSVKHLTPKPTLVLPFESDVGQFQLEISVDGEGIV